jgi:RNA polymerase sigma-70 factor (ECF subfamily)
LAKDYKHIDEATLMARFRADGNIEWLGIILERFTLVLFGVCMKYLKDEEQAKDAVQQVFLKALAEIPKYEIDNIGGWLYQVARNYCLSQLRARKDFAGDEPLKYIPQPEEVPVSLLLEKEQNIDRMKAALKEIKEEQRICVASFYLEKKSYAQIAQETGWDIKQVKSNIQNGKRNLRMKLES